MFISRNVFKVSLATVIALSPAFPPKAAAQTIRVAPAPASNKKDDPLDAAFAALKQAKQFLRHYEADKAFTLLQSALTLFAQMNDRVGQASAQDALGDVYAQSGQDDAAFDLYHKAAEAFRQAGDVVNANAVLGKVGERYLLLGDLEKARAAFAAMTVVPPERSLKETGVAALNTQSNDRKAAAGGVAVVAGLAACFAPGSPDNQQDPKNPPNLGVAPNTPNGVGRMDLRVTDEQGNPVRGVRAQIQSARPGGLYCDCWDSTDAYGRAVMPPIHIADQIKLVLQAPGLSPQVLNIAAQQLAQPLRVAISQAGAHLLPQPAQVATPPATPCFDFYRALLAFATSEEGTARADFLAGRLPEARKHYEDLLAQLNLPNVAQFKETAHFRAAALTALGDIAFREGRFDDAVKFYKESLDNARKDNRLDLMWGAQRGLGRTYWHQYLSSPDDPQAAARRGDAMGSYLAAVRTIEALRAGSLRADESRTAFLANTRNVYDEALSVVTEMALISAGQSAPTEASKRSVVLSGSSLALAATAISVVEQSRARSLLDMLGEQHAGITQDLPADLLKRRNDVLAREQEIADALTGVLPSDGSPRPPVVYLERELEQLNYAYDGIENEIRTRSPRYDSLAGAKPLTLADIQQRVLDAKSALLIYNLGESVSYLWTVTPSEVSVARLPPRTFIESKVFALRAQMIPASLRRSVAGIDAPSEATRSLVHEGDDQAAAPAQQAQTKTQQQAQSKTQTTTPAQAATPNKSSQPRPAGQQTPRPANSTASNAAQGRPAQPLTASVTPATYARAANELYNVVLGPAAQMLGDRRLVVMADGALNFVPFEALVATMPPGIMDYASLDYVVRTNEVAYAPSASVIDAVRKQAAQAGGARQRGPMLIVADPVFSVSDVRVQLASTKPIDGAETRSLTLDSAVEDVSGTKPAQGQGVLQIPRLASTRTEATDISQLARAAQTRADVWLDFDASESNVDTRDLRHYGVIHFATHGLLDARHPQFTGVVLSLVGEKDADGFLRVGEVFNLPLGSPLVMLSACETGLGKEARGEGVIGLTRAFMYAGAPTVGVSLWSVADKSTAQLMSDFYHGLFAMGEQPAAALRGAQLKMLTTQRYSAPFYWAPFIMVGDWN
jgi:CHAT domain-containing protein/tetratricopeptide (TPR) repeat protein